MSIHHAARDNGLRYWLALTRNTVGYYVRRRRWVALVRATWLVVGRGYYLEVCQVCGRRVDLIWWPPDDLYQAATGAGTGGLFCTHCFDTLAAKTGRGYVTWTPSFDDPRVVGTGMEEVVKELIRQIEVFEHHQFDGLDVDSVPAGFLAGWDLAFEAIKTGTELRLRTLTKGGA